MKPHEMCDAKTQSTRSKHSYFSVKIVALNTLFSLKGAYENQILAGILLIEAKDVLTAFFHSLPSKTMPVVIHSLSIHKKLKFQICRETHELWQSKASQNCPLSCNFMILTSTKNGKQMIKELSQFHETSTR